MSVHRSKKYSVGTHQPHASPSPPKIPHHNIQIPSWGRKGREGNHTHRIGCTHTLGGQEEHWETTIHGLVPQIIRPDLFWGWWWWGRRTRTREGGKRHNDTMLWGSGPKNVFFFQNGPDFAFECYELLYDTLLGANMKVLEFR
jgi:hypothetical protein